MPVNRNIIPKDLLEKPQESVLSAGLVSCGNCTAACCREGTRLHLSEDEARKLEQAGTILEEVEPPSENTRKRRFGLGTVRTAVRGTYELASDCGNLTPDGKCAAFGTGDRPDACGAMPRGGYACVEIQLTRVARGLDTFANEQKKD